MSHLAPQGYITAAVGHPRHLEMAVDLALSLRAIDPHRPIALVTDARLREPLRPFAGVFDFVSEIPPDRNWRMAAKLFTGMVSPFERTFFIDADCLVLKSLDALWHAFEGIRFCIPGEYVHADDPRHHHNYPIAALCHSFALPRYYFAYAPMFQFDSDGRAMVAEVMRSFETELEPRGIRHWNDPTPPDEIAFGIVGGRGDFPPFPPLQTMMRPQDLARWTPGHPPEPIFHCIMCPPLDVLIDLMMGVRARREAAGVPQGSVRHWVKKATFKWAQRAVTDTLGLPWRFPSPDPPRA